MMTRIAEFAACLLLVACSSQSPDSTPPEAVTDLTVFRVTETSTTLKWTAPGGDGAEGQATSYDLRYTSQSLPQAWDTATKARGLVPLVAGESESVRVAGLGNGVAYSFGLKTLDAAGNRSGLSNIVQVNTGDVEGPEVVTDLRVAEVTPHTLTVEFTAPGDDGNEGLAVSYDLRYATVPIDFTNWASAKKVVTPAPKPAGSTERIRILSLTPEQGYFMSMTAKDDGGHESALSNSADAVLPTDTVPPSTITDLRVVRTGNGSVTLGWTAPGDDGMDGKAGHYEGRHSQEPITLESWDQAATLNGVGIPQEGGTTEEQTFAALPEETLYFAIRAEDAVGNASGLSNQPQGAPIGHGRIWEVRVDGSGDVPTVQAAIDSASHGDRVLIHPGRYLEHINFKGKRIHVRSAEGPENTILDGNGEPGSVVKFTSGETRESVLEGVTITGGRGTLVVSLLAGGGILCVDTSPTMIGNWIRGNRAGGPSRGFGGGLFVDTTFGKPLVTPVVINNRFENNYSETNGGAITLTSSHVSLVENSFRGNTCRYDGGAVYIFMDSEGSVAINRNSFVQNIAGDHGGAIEAGQGRNTPIEIHNNLFIRNEAHGEDPPGGAGTGGAISMRDWPSNIFNNTFVDNIGTGIGPGCTGGHILVSTEKRVEIRQNIFVGAKGCALSCSSPSFNTVAEGNLYWDNAPTNFGNPKNCFPALGGNDLFTDPLFCDPTSDDYRLRANSPALVKGMGAYSQPGCTPSTSIEMKP